MSPSRSGWGRGGAWEGAGCALALLCVALAACACADADKRAEMSPVPFVLGSRYGRSPPRLITPRNDRFFMGSRYGKRSEPDSDTFPPGAGGLAQRGLAQGGLARGGLAQGGLVTLQCDYTGLGVLYRCRPARTANENSSPYRRAEETPTAPEEE